MKQMLGLALLGSRLFATTSIVEVDATPQQLVIFTNTDQLGFCTYRVSEGTQFNTSVNDVNASLFPGSNADTRPSSITNGLTHVFVAGTRTAALASDHKRYSRSLQANTPHWIGVTCGIGYRSFDSVRQPPTRLWGTPVGGSISLRREQPNRIRVAYDRPDRQDEILHRPAHGDARKEVDRLAGRSQLRRFAVRSHGCLGIGHGPER